MANQEQVERLTRNIYEWNQWRREHPKIRPDLSGASLSYAVLSGAYLSGADLSSADLTSANLSRAILKRADLASANLSRVYLIRADLSNVNLNRANLSYVILNNAYLRYTNLSYAYLSGASLSYTDLSGANLSYADLSRASLSRVDVSGTSFTEAHFQDTILGWVDLSNVKGLETAIHEGPSCIDINSVVLPSDELTRLHFLRGVGFTETQIEYLPSLLTPRPIQYHSLFISYANPDETVAKQLYTDLCKKDVPCWFAPHDQRPGTSWVRGIEEAIHRYDKLLLILSNDALVSNWVQQEVETALYKEATTGQEVLFPIRLDNTVLESDTLWAKRLRQRHIGDFTTWQDEAAYQQAFTTLLRHLKVDKLATT